MKILYILTVLILVSCNQDKPIKVVDFTLEGTHVTFKGHIKDNVALTAEDAKKQLSIALELLDNK